MDREIKPQLTPWTELDPQASPVLYNYGTSTKKSVFDLKMFIDIQANETSFTNDTNETQMRYHMHFILYLESLCSLILSKVLDTIYF